MLFQWKIVFSNKQQKKKVCVWNFDEKVKLINFLILNSKEIDLLFFLSKSLYFFSTLSEIILLLQTNEQSECWLIDIIKRIEGSDKANTSWCQSHFSFTIPVKSVYYSFCLSKDISRIEQRICHLLAFINFFSFHIWSNSGFCLFLSICFHIECVVTVSIVDYVRKRIGRTEWNTTSLTAVSRFIVEIWHWTHYSSIFFLLYSLV